MSAPWCGRPLPDDREGWKTRALAYKEIAGEAQDERDRLRAAARSILWMAKEYAEAGGRGGPEMRDYEAAAAIIGED